MNRRGFITLLGGTAAAWPLTAGAQQSATPVIGFLNGASPEKYEVFVNAFLQGLKETGYAERQNVMIEYRWADGQYARFPEMVRDLIRRQVAVIAVNTPAARIAKQAATNIPIVFFTGEDPVTSGLVKSLSRPGGNATGVTSMFGGLAAKQFGLLRELIPPVRHSRLSRQSAKSNHGTQRKRFQRSCTNPRTASAYSECKHRSGDRPRFRGFEPATSWSAFGAT